MIVGITFDEQTITASNMGHFMNTFSGSQSGVTQGCEITHDSDNMYIASGYFLIAGRQVQITGTQTVPFQTVASGELYCTVVFQIDLTQTNTENTFLQGTIETLTSSSAYPAVTQEDLYDGGTTFQYALAHYHCTSSGVDTFTDMTSAVAVDWLAKSKITLNTSTNTLTIDLT